jgi:hypothetical protein
MALPGVPAWIEQLREPFGLFVHPRQICAFPIVARKTGERQVKRSSRSLVFSGSDVIDFVGEAVVLLRHLAVFTTSLCSQRKCSRLLSMEISAVHRWCGSLFSAADVPWTS